ncbi:MULTISPECIES: hypothetical protein [unclassified Brucella]|nr:MULTISPECIES: hypothetical protein [unclassified Brucella]MRN47098.1 hypothetical protein [Brucella sp. 10RB9212]
MAAVQVDIVQGNQWMWFGAAALHPHQRHKAKEFLSRDKADKPVTAGQ